MIIVIVTMSFLSLAHGQTCKTLTDGKYKVQFNREFGGITYILVIKEGHFTEYKNGKETGGDVLLNEDCNLRLGYPTHLDTNTKNEVQNLLLKSDHPYFIFEKTTGKKLVFRLTGVGGPHVTSGTGKFIRLN